MKKFAIITTHPIQYNAPFFKRLTETGKVRLKVFYTWPQAMEGFDDPDFGTPVKWDIPLLEGYDWEALKNVSKTPSSKKWSGIDCPDIISELKAFDPEAIMVYGWNLKSHCKVMRYFKGRIPVWFFGDSTLLDEKPGIKKIIRRLWLTWVYLHIDKAFYAGTHNKEYFKAHGLKEDQLVFFPHAVDNERFFDNEERLYEHKAKKWRTNLGYHDEDIVVLFVGKLEPKKDPLILLKAIEQLNNSWVEQLSKPVQLLFVGNGSLESSLINVSEKLTFVKFLPFQNQSQMPLVYRLGDIFCLPSQGPGETWGLAVNEAQACGRSVLASDKVGCTVDLITPGVNGTVFTSGNLEDLCLNLKQLLASLPHDHNAINRHLYSKWNYTKKCEAIENTL